MCFKMLVLLFSSSVLLDGIEPLKTAVTIAAASRLGRRYDFNDRNSAPSPPDPQLVNRAPIHESGTPKLPSASAHGCEFASNCHSCTNNPNCRYCVWKSIDGDHFVKDKDNRALAGRCVDLKSKDWMTEVMVSGTYYDEETVPTSVPNPIYNGSSNSVTESRWHGEEIAQRIERKVFCGVLIPDYSAALTCSDIEAAALFQSYREALQSVRSFASSLYAPNDETPTLEQVLERAGEVESSSVGLGQFLFWFGLLLPAIALFCCISCIVKQRKGRSGCCCSGLCCCRPCGKLLRRLLPAAVPKTTEPKGAVCTHPQGRIVPNASDTYPKSGRPLTAEVGDGTAVQPPDVHPLTSCVVDNLSSSWPPQRPRVSCYEQSSNHIGFPVPVPVLSRNYSSSSMGFLNTVQLVPQYDSMTAAWLAARPDGSESTMPATAAALSQFSSSQCYLTPSQRRQHQGSPPMSKQSPAAIYKSTASKLEATIATDLESLATTAPSIADNTGSFAESPPRIGKNPKN